MELVRPWFPALHSGFNVPDGLSPDELKAARATGVVWVSWDLSRHHDVDAPPVFPAEAVHLVALSLAAAESNNDWVFQIDRVWPMDWIQVFDDQRLRLGIKIQIDSQLTLTRSCGQFFVEDASFLASGDYNEVRGQLEAMAAEKGRHIHDVRVPVRVCLCAPDRDEQDTEFDASLLEILHIATLQATVDRSSLGDGSGPLLRLSEVELQVGRKSWSNRTILRVGQLLALGVQVNPIDMRVARVNMEMAPVLISSLQRFCGVGDEQHGSDTIIVEATEDTRSLDAMFSALLMSTSVRDLQIKIRRSSIKNQATRERLWRWIALVFFSGHATNGIENLTLNVSTLKDSDVVVIDELLRANDPLRSLFLTKSQQRVATASKFRLEQPVEASLQATSSNDVDPESLTIVFDRPLRDLPVLDGQSRDSDEVCVLLPGWGQAWITSSDAVITESPTHRGPSIRSHRHLVLQNGEQRGVGSVVNLLRLLSNCVSSLGLENCDDSEATLRRIIESCPRLEEVRSDNLSLSSLGIITGFYEDGICHAQRLHLSLHNVLEEDDSKMFFDTLADTHHPMTKCLRLLEFEYESEELFSRVGHALLKMLEQNRSLCELYVDAVYDNDRDDDGVEEKAEIQGDCNSQYSPVVIPFGVSRKLAFLSVVQEVSRPTDARAMHLFDANVLTKIFRFAGDKRTRYVRTAFNLIDG